MVVTITESPLFDSCKDCACCISGIPRDEIDMDEDVLEEELRIMGMNTVP